MSYLLVLHMQPHETCNPLTSCSCFGALITLGFSGKPLCNSARGLEKFTAATTKRIVKRCGQSQLLLRFIFVVMDFSRKRAA